MTELKFAWKKDRQSPLPEEEQEYTGKRHQDRHVDFLKRLERIIKLEKKRGSLVTIADSDQELIEFQRENNVFFKDKRARIIDPEKQDIILACISKGYTLTEVTHISHCSATTVKQIMCDAGLVLRPPFKYCLKAIKKGKIDFYARNTRQLSHYLGLSFYEIKNEEQLRLKGYRLRKIHKLWYQIPNNVLYSANDVETIYLKKGIQSFEDKELKVQKEV
ncbi:hypothetical protein [Lactobacillus gasseri]|uniref:hypothetical protein n=2 Tax=Lactobacillus TaxID=1578 RepID=UPI00207384FC|nr:hypothetical protein [Lactobacillus gasseri]